MHSHDAVADLEILVGLDAVSAVARAQGVIELSEREFETAGVRRRCG